MSPVKLCSKFRLDNQKESKEKIDKQDKLPL